MQLNNVRIRVSRTEVGRKVEYSYKKTGGIRFNDVTVKFIKSLDSFDLTFADSFWVDGEQEELKERWFDKTKTINI